MDLQCCNYCHLPSHFPSKLQSFTIVFHHKLVTRERQGIGQWMNSSIIHDNICSLIHKLCHPKSYHGDTKCHMTLDIIFNVVIDWCRCFSFLMIFYNSLEPIATPLHLLVVFSVTYYSELHNVVTLCQVKSFILCIIYVTYSIFVGNQ